jgi:hypothetical protein
LIVVPAPDLPGQVEYMTAQQVIVGLIGLVGVLLIVWTVRDAVRDGRGRSER